MVVCLLVIESGEGTSVEAYTTPTKTPSIRKRLRNVAATILYQRRRFCFALRFFFPPPGGRPPPLPTGRLPPVGGLTGGRPPPPPPERAAGRTCPSRPAVVRARPPAAGRRAPAAPLPEPAARARAGGGRRSAPAWPTRAVWSWGGTRWPLPAVVGGQVAQSGAAWRSQGDVFSCVPRRAGGIAVRHGPGRRRLLGRRPTAGLAWCPPRGQFGTQDVGGDEVVPAATAADLDRVDGELVLRGVHAGQFRPRLRLPGHRTQPVAVDIADEGQPFSAADRARGVGRLAVVLRGPGQVGARVADLEQTGPSRVHLGDERTPLQRVVHHRPSSGHGANVRTDGPPVALLGSRHGLRPGR